MKILSLEKTGKMDVKMARRASIFNLLCWPLSAALYYAGLNGLGYLIIWAAALSLFVVMRTGLFRVATGQAMDDVEIQMQLRANTYAYGALSCIVVFGLLFAYIGHDTLRINAPQLLRFETHGVLDFLLWMAIDLMLILPATFLAWLLPLDEIEDE